MTLAPNIIEKSELVASRLKLIANANRLRIVCRLLEGEVSVGDIETELDIRQPTLSREIAKLRDGGIVTARRQSKVVFYSLTDPDMKRLIEAVCYASDDAPNISVRSTPKISRFSQPLNFNPRPKFSNSSNQPSQRSISKASQKNS